MGIKIIRDRGGNFRPTWYGRLTYKGRTNEKNLGIEIKGTIPLDENGNAKLSAQGDEAFERSRKAAQKALEAWRKETRLNPAELQESAYKAHTGISGAGVPFPDLIKKWKELKRQRKPTPERTRNAEVTFKRFADFARAFAADSGKRCDTLNEITPAMVAAWFDSIKDAYAWGTVKDMMHLMSGAFKRWSTNGQINPFSDIVLRGSKEAGEEKKRTERKALTAEQFARLMECARGNERFYPLIVCAAYTGMRIGDVCRMKIADIDLQAGTIDCVTAKAGVRVNIPILTPELHEILSKHCALPADGRTPSPYVFPWAAAQYEKNRTAIVRGVKPLFARAIYGDEKPPEEVAQIDVDNPAAPVEIEDACIKAGFSEAKRKRVIEVYRRFKAGEPSNEIAAALNIARGQVSNYLKDAERLTGEELRPRAKKNGKVAIADLLERTRVERTIGKYAASVWGWHNLRHNFITHALNNGVPIHKVAAIVGHSATAMTAGYADLTTQTGRKQPHAAALMPPTETIAPAVAMTPDAIIAALNEEERKELARKLLGL